MIDLQEFVDKGYLQEANRLFFHPVGLSLRIVRDGAADGPLRIAGVDDWRNDLEGGKFAPCDGSALTIMQARASFVKNEFEQRVAARTRLLESPIEPLTAKKSPWGAAIYFVYQWENGSPEAGFVVSEGPWLTFALQDILSELRSCGFYPTILLWRSISVNEAPARDDENRLKQREIKHPHEGQGKCRLILL